MVKAVICIIYVNLNSFNILQSEEGANALLIDLILYKRINEKANTYEKYERWEFPGGKIEEGETREAALRREIIEELEVVIEVDDFLQTVEYTYPNFHLTMHCYFSHVVEGSINYVEHTAGRWLTESELDSVKWLPADMEVVERLKSI